MKTVKLLFVVGVLLVVALLIVSCGATPAPTEAPAPVEEAASPTPAPAVEPATAEPTQEPEAAGPKTGGQVIFATSIDVPSLEPHLEAADAWQRRKPLIYQNLTWIDNDVIVQPQLAESWEISDDGVEYIFHLRQGVKFHNGKVLDAEDVKYSLERQLDEEVGSAGRGDLVMIDTVEVVDANTVKITLKEPTGPFLVALGGRYNAIIPKDSAPDGEALRRTAIGTGPFMVKAFVPGERLELEKFPDYWEEGKPYVDQLTIQVIPDEQTIMAGLRTGSIDMAVLEDARNYLLLQDEGTDLRLIQTPAIKLDTLELPPDIEPVNDVRVRQAIMLALDKEEIMMAGTMGLGRVVGVMPPAMTFWALPPEDLPNQARDVERAKELLAEAGYPDGFDMTLRTIVGYATMAADAPVIAANLGDAGIRVTIETVDIGVWIEDWRNLREPITRNAWGGFMDPDALFYRHFHTPPEGMDFRRWNNAEGDELLERGRASSDPDERQAIYNDFQQLMAEEGPMVSLYSADLLSVSQPSVEGYIQHPSGFYYGFENIWLDR